MHLGPDPVSMSTEHPNCFRTTQPRASPFISLGHGTCKASESWSLTESSGKDVS